MSQILRGFKPHATQTARVLILGSMPGEASLAAGQYYALRHNAFWPIMGELLGFDPTIAYAERLAALAAANIALWDTCQTCIRQGSLDSAIENPIPNDFRRFLAEHPKITRIYFNGAKAQSLFHALVTPDLPPPVPQFARLPSTSPAYAGLSRAAKTEAWRVILQFIHTA
jgi:hypoxanthine-DNA glycosylase